MNFTTKCKEFETLLKQEHLSITQLCYSATPKMQFHQALQKCVAILATWAQSASVWTKTLTCKGAFLCGKQACPWMQMPWRCGWDLSWLINACDTRTLTAKIFAERWTFVDHGQFVELACLSLQLTGCLAWLSLSADHNWEALHTCVINGLCWWGGRSWR